MNAFRHSLHLCIHTCMHSHACLNASNVRNHEKGAIKCYLIALKSLSVCLYLRPFVWSSARCFFRLFVCLPLHLFVLLSLCLFVCLSGCLSVSPSVCLVVCLPLRPFVWLSLCWFFHVSGCLSSCPFHPSVDSYVCLLVHPSVCLSSYMSLGSSVLTLAPTKKVQFPEISFTFSETFSYFLVKKF